MERLQVFMEAPGEACSLLKKEAVNQEKQEFRGQVGRSRRHGDSLHHLSFQRGEVYIFGTCPLLVVVVFRSICTSNEHVAFAYGQDVQT